MAQRARCESVGRMCPNNITLVHGGDNRKISFDTKNIKLESEVVDIEIGRKSEEYRKNPDKYR